MSIWSKVKSVLDELPLELNLRIRQSFDLPNIIEALINRKRFPDGVKLWAKTQLITLAHNINTVDAHIHNFNIAI